MINTLETTTFLFTDIQGSTRLWEQYPEAMTVALARHDSIVRQAIESHGGHVFKTGGDAFYAAFSNAPAAVLAALDAQRSLQDVAQNTPAGDPVIRVRMGLHSGAAEQRDNDYFGPPLNRVARLMAAGHGGQTLLSAAAKDLLQNQLPEGVDLRDMGERRLKDLARPEHIYQLVAPDLPAEFPPLKTLDAFRTNLPAQLTSFIGREKEIAAIKQLVRANRLTTLTGPGGTGKSRLSLQVASTLLDSFPDGVWFIELAALADPALVPQTVMITLGLREDNEHSPLDVLNDFLHTKTALLLLDNCEHLIEASAQLTEALLHGCLHLHILTSSRESLGITGEISFRVPSLSIPDTHHSPSLETSRQYEAVRLFVDRAQTSQPSFTLTETNAFAVTQICARLDGIPLAIELAAARVKMLKAEQIAERLDDRFRLLTGGSRTALPRQQTLRAMIDWSYDLLSEPERTLLRRLSVFAGGWTLEAAEQVCKDEVGSQKDEGKSKDGFLQPSSFIPSTGSGQRLHPSYFILDTLDQLVNKSLIVLDTTDTNVETRYRLLETVRQYAREKLFETGEGAQVRDLHLQYFMLFCERAEPELNHADQLQWMARLEAELDNLRAAIEWSLEHDVQSGLRLASALRWFWVSYDHIRDGNGYLSQLLAQPDALARTAVRAKALATQSVLSNYIDNTNLPERLAQESLSIFQELGNRHGAADAILALAASINRSDPVRGRALIDEALMHYQTLDDKPGLARALGMWGLFADNQDPALARSAIEQSLKICREIGHLAGVGSTLLDLGRWAIFQGEYQLAGNWLDDALEINRSIGPVRMAETLLSMADLAFRQGHYEQARARYQENAAIMKEKGRDRLDNWRSLRFANVLLRLGDIKQARQLLGECQQQFKKETNIIGVICCLESLASLAVLQNQPAPAAQLFAWTDLMREHIQDLRPFVEQADVDRDLTSIRTQIDEASLAAAHEAGHAMSMDEAMALAMEATHD